MTKTGKNDIVGETPAPTAPELLTGALVLDMGAIEVARFLPALSTHRSSQDRLDDVRNVSERNL